MTNTDTITSIVDAEEIEHRLTRFLESRLGIWPPSQPLELVASSVLDEPRWDGSYIPMIGIESPQGTVLSYSPTRFPTASSIDLVALEDELGTCDAYMTIPEMFGRPEMHFGRAVFRYVDRPADLPEIGEWVSRDDPRIPSWLRPFNGDVLIHWEDGAYAAGVGIKKHNDFGHEISVGTEPEFRGRGFAKMLVAQAAKHILQEGAIPLYMHGDRNAASSRVADQAGFPDRGWHLVELR
ncbi:MAG TPA: GNAT family N-acetyltransferase [Thermomicrobiales bacterium]|nr:GNAT family N-acetyltransferase [Thermomicrobiales bacterium]